MRESPWGPIPVADAHIHFFSHNFFGILAGQKPDLSVESMGPTLGWDMPPKSPEDLAAIWARELDRHDVDQAVLIASLPGDEDSVARAAAAFPSRFFSYYMVNPLAAGAVARLQGALEHGRVHGLCLFPAMHRYSMADESAAAILEALQATRPATLVFVHCGALSVGVRDRLGLASPFDMRLSNPIDLHAIARRFPQLRFVIPHFGAGFLREALMVADLCPNIFLDTSSSNRWMRFEGLDLRAVFRRAIDVVGTGRLLFGTDSSFFPRGWNDVIFDDQSRALYELGVKAEEAHLIFGGNLRRLLA